MELELLVMLCKEFDDFEFLKPLSTNILNVCLGKTRKSVYEGRDKNLRDIL